MKLTSDRFKDGDYLGAEHILSADYGFGCAGGQAFTASAVGGAPEGTKSFAVLCFDPDAPTGGRRPLARRRWKRWKRQSRA